ncbi:DEAD/DEAH box helicase family protein [Tenacibaculum finnmarkense]|uniref:DEAD/DEAH box helicase family protein n=1 Tax=Tenacibaculum finnmarkense TaxID=2781243 RepID=UPI001EFBAD87|nr:DEAD/DEAH box helicase family protein [Tenacibaculum finnmarkense]MCG8754758.1 DEAD/DEAH box helicase family protein [Tenacibaculum finnmarkense]MCG8782938.1 DEAD/DEAH box helicase family protein [Tenacibaculum finnmarkense]
MNELILQDKYLMNFFTNRTDGLQYKEVKANTVSKNHFVVEDLKYFISETTLNKTAYRKLLKKFDNNEKQLLQEFQEELNERIGKAKNMALFINNNQSITFKGVKINLFYPSGSITHGDTLFDENQFSVVQELPYIYKHEGKTQFSFRPDITFFLNGIFLGYSELKSNYNNQSAHKDGKIKIAKDYQKAVTNYLKIADGNDVDKTIRKDFLKIFEKAIHITTTDVQDTFIIRTISNHFDEVKTQVEDNSYDFDKYKNNVINALKPYPLNNLEATKQERFEEVFKALYSKKMIEREILYYNFLERELVKSEKATQKEYKHNDGRLIAPRPKQKFGADKIINKIDEFLEHENEPDYFINKLRKQLTSKGLGGVQIEELINKRLKYQNNKNVYSLLLQYAAGFGKSNIIGWTSLMLKDLRKNDAFVYDKIMLVVDRVQLRDQLDSKMFNMNIAKSMFIEANSKKSFLEALNTDKRIVIVNLQKFNSIREFLDDEALKKLSSMRIAFLIDEIHRSNSGQQHEEMVSLFDELQNSFDTNKAYKKTHQKKNLIIGFTATPSDVTLARFGEYNKYAEAEKIWTPFDSYTMKEAIDDGYILNPIKGIVPVSAKMYFEKPDDALEGFEGDVAYSVLPNNPNVGIDANGKKFRISKKNIYENEERIEAISKFVAKRLVTAVYHNIRGTAKAMFAVSSIKAAIKYRKYIKKYFEEFVTEKKYERFKNAPIYIVYSSDGQKYESATTLNDGLSEAKVLQNFAIKKNGLVIVVDKLQTGFDEPKLHTLFLDKEIRGINAVQTISRVNRTAGKYKTDCKIIDLSYKNVNVNNIKQAFEHFSNVVISDFDPLGQEQILQEIYENLKQEHIFKAHFKLFKAYQLGNKKDITAILNFEGAVTEFIRKQPEDAKNLKKSINNYFKILNLILFVIEVEDKYSEEYFTKFWEKFNILYNTLKGTSELIDDVEVYFDNRLGIVMPPEEVENTSTGSIVREPSGDYGVKQYKFDILAVIEKRNEEEEEIEALILDFQHKIENFFEYVNKEGIRIIAKIKSTKTAFDEDEIYKDFEIIYKKYVRRNRKSLGQFFIKETEEIVNQLCDDFEKTLKE